MVWTTAGSSISAVATGVMDERAVRRLADARSFERGRSYLDAGLVQHLTLDRDTVTAVVHGAGAYQVRLVVGAGGLAGRCSCPYGADGVFCKHCVATALAWLRGDVAPGKGGAPRGERRPRSDDDLLDFLTAQDSAWLAGELLRAAAADPLLRARLDVAAGGDAREVVDEKPLRARLARTIRIDGYVGYREAYSYSQDVEAELEQVSRLIEQGFPDAAMRLAEYALKLLEDAAGLVDDSDGEVGGVMSRTAEIHLEACRAGEPDPVRLAEFLVDRAVNSDHEVFLDALPDYAGVLGPEGMARYRELVEAAWRGLPPKRPRDYGVRRFAVTHLMERLADLEGGADALIAVLERDVTSGYDVLRIAQRLCADGRDDEALQWLDRGMAEFSPDERVRSMAAECHVRSGRRSAAEELLWQNFVARPGLPTYRALHEVAADNFPAWRGRALALLGEVPSTAARFSARPYLQPAGRSDLVEVLLWEDEIEAAWRAAVDGGCRDELWLRLARARAATHPADGIPILTAAADQRIDHKNRAAYQEAAKLLVEAGVLFARCDRSDDFRSHLAGLRAAHRPKRALREELDRAGLP